MIRDRLQQGEEDRHEINISPLIDMVFILLIFFIVTTVFVEETGVEVRRPEAASQQALEKESVMIALTAEGNVIYGGREIGVSGVRGVVRRMSLEKPAPVILQADRAVQAELIVRVMDEARLGGAGDISLSTEGPGS